MKKCKRIILWVLTILWMGVIFYMSAQNADKSSAMSNGLTMKVLKIFVRNFDTMSEADQAAIWDTTVFIVRKLAHFTEYFILGCLTCALTYDYTVKVALGIGIPAAVCILYAASDEFHQYFSDGRSPQLRDVCIDSAGALLGIFIIAAAVHLYRKRRMTAGRH